MRNGRDLVVDGAPPAAVRSRGAEVEARLRQYLEMVARWNQAANLVSARVGGAGLWGLVEETLAAEPYLPEGARFLDVGSGAGIPAIPLLLTRPDLTAVLTEVRERRWAFLREVVREMGVSAEVRRQRLEEVSGEFFAAVTVRGVARGVWEAAAARLLLPGGVVVWWTGEERARQAKFPGRVLVCPVRGAGQGAVLVWSPCFT